MKTPPLPEIDLARIAPLPKHQKQSALERFRLGRPPFSYGPFRTNLSDILNVEAGMLGPVQRTPWAKIDETIRKKSRSDDEERANLRVAEGLYAYAEAMHLRGRRHDILSFGFGIGRKVVLWHPVVLAIDGRPMVPFFDPRRTKNLTREGRRFVFSVMHERIRVADPDFQNAVLGVFQFVNSTEGARQPKVYTDEGVLLYSFDELEEMVRETYEIWCEVYEDRTADIRRRSSGGEGSLL